MTQTRDFERRQIALDQGVRWVVNAGRDTGDGGYADAVKAAERFHAFLAGETTTPPPKSLDELAAKIQWDDPLWRRDFLGVILDSVTEGLAYPAIVEAMSNLSPTDKFEPVFIKGVAGLEVHSLSKQAIYTPAIDTPLVAIDIFHTKPSVVEIAPALALEYQGQWHEDLVRSFEPGALRGFVESLVATAIQKIDGDALQAIDALLGSAGFTRGGLETVPPFRVEFVHFGGWKAKDWVEDGGELWHVWLKTKLGGAAFVVPQP